MILTSIIITTINDTALNFTSEDLRDVILKFMLIVLACVSFILATYLKEKIIDFWKKKNLTPKKLKKDVVRDHKIYSILGQMEEKFHCDRAFLFLLHNGGSFGNGLDMKKMSCVYEICRLGIEPTIQNNQALLLTGLPAAVQTIIDSQEKPICLKTGDIENEHFKSMLVRHGVEIFLIRALTKGNRIIGFIGVDYCWEYDQPIDTDFLDQYAVQCESLLSGNIDCLTCDHKGLRCLWCKVFGC